MLHWSAGALWILLPLDEECPAALPVAEPLSGGVFCSLPAMAEGSYVALIFLLCFSCRSLAYERNEPLSSDALFHLC